ncbi:MAG: M23 family metallopeptidase [Bacteroidales bacterium]|nr:M23 family metallopeptidase [Bacteroidales bacterium]
MRRKRKESILGGIVRYFLATVSLSVVFYIAFALLLSTEEERRLDRENRQYERLYPRLKEKERLIGDVVEGLLVKDDAIYRRLFETGAPTLDPVTAADLIADSDSLSDSFYLSYSTSKTESLMMMADHVQESFRKIYRLLEERRDSLPPLTLPLADMSYVQTGASVGLKHNPVYKVEMHHEGIDLIAPQGEPVYAVADGTVRDVLRSRKGLGNIVEIDHGSGYVTRYALLGDISVVRGRSVKRGQQVGTVGISAGAFAPHLHYEVLRNGEIQDPVNYLFASVTPDEYAKMLYMSVSTAQSLD